MTESKIPTDALEGLMKKVFIDKSLQPGLFWDALLKADLYVPLVRPVDKGYDAPLEEWPVQLATDSQGKQILWFFTSPAAALDYTEKELPCIKRTGSDLFGLLKAIKKEIVLIGPDQITLSLDPTLVRSLAEGKVPAPPTGAEQERVIAKTAKVKVGAPAPEAEKLIPSFTDLFKQMPVVLEASFMQVEDDNGSRLLLGLKMEKESREELKRVAQQVAKAAEGVLPRGDIMDITLIDGSLKEAFEKWGKTFYKK